MSDNWTKQNTQLKQELQKLKDLKLSCKSCSKVKQFDIQISGNKTQAVQVDRIDLGIQSKIEDYSKHGQQLSDNVHSRCDKMIEELKIDKNQLLNEKDQLQILLQNKEEEWLKMFKSIYNLSKKPDFHEELKEKLESINQSVKESLHQSPVQNSSDRESVTEQHAENREDQIDDASLFKQQTEYIPDFNFDVVKNSNLPGEGKGIRQTEIKPNIIIQEKEINDRFEQPLVFSDRQKRGHIWLEQELQGVQLRPNSEQLTQEFMEQEYFYLCKQCGKTFANQQQFTIHSNYEQHNVGLRYDWNGQFNL